MPELEAKYIDLSSLSRFLSNIKDAYSNNDTFEGFGVKQADKLTTSRNIKFAGGDVSGNFNFDGSASVDNISLSIGEGKVTNVMLAGSIDQSKVTNLTSDLASKVSDVSYDGTNNKLTKTVGGVTSDIVTASTLMGGMPDATTTSRGIMTAAQAAKLDSLEPGGGTQSDWNQNDSTASDYVKNRTHYTETSTRTYKTLTAPWSTDSGYFLYEEYGVISELPADTPLLTEGNSYTITFDGTSYTKTALLYSGYYVYVGNMHYLDPNMEDTGETFCLLTSPLTEDPDTEYFLNGVVVDGQSHVEGDTKDISVSGIELSVVKLDPKYVPAVADWSVNDTTSNTYIQNRTHYSDDTMVVNDSIIDSSWVKLTDTDPSGNPVSYYINPFIQGVNLFYLINETATARGCTIFEVDLMVTDMYGTYEKVRLKGTDEYDCYLGNKWLLNTSNENTGEHYYIAQSGYAAVIVADTNHYPSIKIYIEEPSKVHKLHNRYLPSATTSTVGAVKVGDGLTVDTDGTLSSNAGDLSRITNSEIDTLFPPTTV